MINFLNPDTTYLLSEDEDEEEKEDEGSIRKN